MFWDIIGILAAGLTTFSLVPQISKVLKTKSAYDVSPVMLLQFSLGVSLWAVYGIHLKNTIIITANLITLITISILFVLYLKYGRKPKSP